MDFSPFCHINMDFIGFNCLGLLFFINWFTDIFTADFGTEGKIKINIKHITSTGT